MPVVVNLFTGVLGAGKTVVLRHLLEDRALPRKPAVLVGEFAEQGIDATMLEPTGAVVKQLTDTGRGDGSKSYVTPLARMVKTGRFDRIFIETSGVTEIGRLVTELIDDDELRERVLIGPTVVVIDAAGFQLHSTDFARQFWSQVEVADIVVVNKVDLVDPSEVKAIKEEVAARNPDAEIVSCYMGQIRRGSVNDPVRVDFAPRILSTRLEDSRPEDFESFVYESDLICFDRVRFGHLLLNLPGVHLARFKGKLLSYDKTYCVNGFPGRLDWDNTPVKGDTSIALIGFGLDAERERITALLDKEIELQADHDRWRDGVPERDA